MARFTGAVDGDRVQELVRIIQDGKKAKRKIDVLTWGLLAAERVGDVLKEIDEINRKVSMMERAELEFCIHAYRIVDNVIAGCYRYFVNANFFDEKEDLRQTLIIELFKLLKTYDENVNSSFARYSFSALKLVVLGVLFGDIDGDYSSPNEKKFRTVTKSSVVSYEALQETGNEGGYSLDLENRMLRKELCCRVREAVAKMPAGKERQLLELYFFREMSRKEIYEVMGLDKDKFTYLYNKALKIVEKALDNDDFRGVYNEYREIM